MESNISIAHDFASFTKHLAIRRLRFSLTAIGRTPLFLDKAVSDALQRAFETNEGNLPLLQYSQALLLLQVRIQSGRENYTLLRAIDALDTF